MDLGRHVKACHERVSARRYLAQDQAHIRSISCTINANLREDRRRRTEEVGEEIDCLLGTDPLLHKEFWNRMEGWYRAVVDRTPPPFLGYP